MDEEEIANAVKKRMNEANVIPQTSGSPGAGFTLLFTTEDEVLVIANLDLFYQSFFFMFASSRLGI